MRMTTLFAALALYPAACLPAAAACSASAMAGSWFVVADDLVCPTLSFAANGSARGNCDSDGTTVPVTVQLKIDSTCKMTGTAKGGGTTYALRGRVEQVTGSLKPNTLTGVLTLGSQMGGVIGFRN